MLVGCATSPPQIPEPLRSPQTDTDASNRAPPKPNEQGLPTTRFESTPRLPAIKPATSEPVLSPISERDQRPITLNIEGLAVPAFINEVYGNLLGLSFQMDAAVQKKTDTINLRLTTPQPASKVHALADQALRDDEVAVEKRGSVLRFTTGKGATPATPDSPIFVFGRKLPENLSEETSVVQFLALDAVRNTQAAGWLRQAFQSQKVTINEDPERNALVLAGPAGMVRQAGEVALLLDQPFMRGQYSLRIDPANWTALTLAKRLEEILQAEGYSATQRPGTGGSVLVLPVEEINAVLVFAADANLLAHVRQWVSQLDQPQPKPDQDGLFYYLARSVPAEQMVKTLEPLLPSLVGIKANSATSPTSSMLSAPITTVKTAMAGTATNQSLPGATATAAAQASGTGNSVGNRLAVDAGRNALLFSGSGEQWSILRPMLETMDQPAKLALIEVTVAEITLGDSQDTGIEWLFKNVNIGNFAGTLSNTGLMGTSLPGLNYALTNQDGSRVLLNAFASNNQVSILSNPRVMVRNGQEASIEVGTDVPIITSQATASDVTQSGTSSILQQVQYRKTGVLLQVKPTIYAGRRVDLDIHQEVSEAQTNTTSTVSSPQILNRTLKTSLSLKDGESVLLGGLVSTNSSGSNQGIPWIKDVPVLGYLFRADSTTRRRTELVVLITPYVINDAREAEAITTAFRQRLSFGTAGGADSTASAPAIDSPNNDSGTFQ